MIVTSIPLLTLIILLPLLCDGELLRSFSQFHSTFEKEGEAEASNVFSSSQQQYQAGNSSRPVPLPRDFYIDQRTGLAYTKIPGAKVNGNEKPDLYAFQPHGNVGGQDRRLGEENRNLKGTTDTIPPSISNIQPVNGATVSNTFTVQATITDNVKVKSATVTLVNTATKATSKFNLVSGPNNVWAVTVQTTTSASLQMTITATDTSGKTTTSSPAISFTAGSGTSGGGTAGGGTTTITSAQWSDRSAPIARAAGRVLFDMPDSKGSWTTYVCSGTLIQLPSSATTVDRSIVMTAAHCVYEDVVKSFSRNALFIPQQDDGGSDRTDYDCTNDALGCIALDYGFVSDEWANRVFPNNIGVDYGFYVSKSTSTKSKGKTIGVNGDIVPMVANFGTTATGDWTYAMGYSYNQDPKFMYSYEKDSTVKVFLAPNYFLPSSKLSGGASGGPWTQDDPYSGNGVSIIGVNSWSYTNKPGMASSPCYTGGAACVYNAAATTDIKSFKGSGLVVKCNV